MSPKVKKVNMKKSRDKVPATKRTMKGVQNFSDIVVDNTHRRLDDMIGETIYIVKMEVMPSEQYGSGWKIHFKDFPNAEITYTAACFSQYVVPKFDALWQMTHEGKTISLTNPVKVTIKAAGKSYTLV